MSVYRWGPFLAEVMRRELRLSGWDRCIWCGGLVTKRSFSVEHIIPRSEGGSDNAGNLAAAHRVCNQIRDRIQAKPSPTVFRWALAGRLFDDGAAAYLLAAEIELKFPPPLL